MSRKINIVLIGYGCVGQGFKKLVDKRDELQLKTIVVRDLRKPRQGVDCQLSNEALSAIRDPEIDLVVEATDDPENAIEWHREAISLGKPFITANKQFVWRYLNGENKQSETPTLYEASCGAAIPIIRSLESCFSQGVSKIEGILNGSSNYILTRVFKDRLDHDIALQQAQRAGFAESDPSFDLNGTDATTKLAILIWHAFGVKIAPHNIERRGIDRLNGADYHLARQLGGEIRLLASASFENGRLSAIVSPVLVKPEDRWNAITDEQNAVLVTDRNGEEHFFVGKGAGANATGTALLNDVLACIAGFRYAKRDKVEWLHARRKASRFWLRTHALGTRPDPISYRIFEHRLHGPFDLWKIDRELGIPDPLIDHPDNGVIFEEI